MEEQEKTMIEVLDEKIKANTAGASDYRKAALEEAENNLKKVANNFDKDEEFEESDVKLKPLTMEQLAKYSQDVIDKYNFTLLYQDNDNAAKENIEQYTMEHPSLNEFAINLKALNAKNNKEDKESYIDFLLYDYNWATIQVISEIEQAKVNKMMKSYMPMELINVFFSKNRVVYGNDLFKSVYDDTISMAIIKSIISKHGFYKKIIRHSKPLRLKRMTDRITYVACRFAKNKQDNINAILDRTTALFKEIFDVDEDVTKAYIIALAIYANKVDVDNVVECATVYFMVNAILGLTGIDEEMFDIKDGDTELDPDAKTYYTNIKECVNLIKEVLINKGDKIAQANEETNSTQNDNIIIDNK